MRRWTLRADNHEHHHGVVSLSERPLYLALSWRRSATDTEQSVGTFQLDLDLLLAGGYIRREGSDGEGKVRLRVVRSDDGKFWIQTRSDGPRLLVPASAAANGGFARR
jgi:hypothetical protein